MSVRRYAECFTQEPGSAFGNSASSAAAPTIVSFEAINNGNNSWTFTGRVQDQSMAGLVVTISGIPSANNVSVTVQADGSFSYMITLQAGQSGGVTAQCTDSLGQTSNVVTAYLWS